MKFCTRIINKQGGTTVQKQLDEWVFLENYTPRRLFIILYYYSNKKALFNRSFIVFELGFSSFFSGWKFFNTKSTPNFLKSTRVLSKLILKSLTLGPSVFSKLMKQLFYSTKYKVYFVLALKLQFRKCVTYILCCSFIKSLLLRGIFIVCSQLNNIKQHAWRIKKTLRKESKGLKRIGTFRIQSKIYDGVFLQ